MSAGAPGAHDAAAFFDALRRLEKAVKDLPEAHRRRAAVTLSMARLQPLARQAGRGAPDLRQVTLDELLTEGGR
jgi:hypothetical protein